MLYILTNEQLLHTSYAGQILVFNAFALFLLFASFLSENRENEENKTKKGKSWQPALHTTRQPTSTHSEFYPIPSYALTLCSFPLHTAALASAIVMMFFLFFNCVPAKWDKKEQNCRKMWKTKFCSAEATQSTCSLVKIYNRHRTLLMRLITFAGT